LLSIACGSFIPGLDLRCICNRPLYLQSTYDFVITAASQSPASPA
jgi:hypothetical protein